MLCNCSIFTGIIENLKQENTALHSDVNDLLQEKQSYDQQIENFKMELNSRVDNWKVSTYIFR